MYADYRVHLRKVRDRHRKKRYGLSPKEYDALLVEQAGRCAACDRLPEAGLLDVDHNHHTGKVRALLCRQCNVALGLVGESVETLVRLIEYLRRHS